MDKIICDSCDNYSQNMSGTYQYCYEHISNGYYLSCLYWMERLEGYKKFCKGYKKIGIVA